MPSKNVETLRAAHQAFNTRDFDKVLKTVREDISYHDRARGHTFKGRDGFREHLEGWVSAFSNAEVTEARYIDAGSTVIAEFVGRGVNDGPLGTLSRTGRKMNLPFCEIVRFDDKGLITTANLYYDQLSLMAQLGHAPAELGAETG